MQGIIDSILNWTLAVDWVESLKDWLTIVKDIVICLSAGITSGLAIYGFNLWKEQILDKDKFDLAKKLMYATYRVRNSVEKARIIDDLGGSVQAYMNQYNTTRHKFSDSQWQEINNLLHRFQTRYSVIHDSLNELELITSEAEIFFGPEVQKKRELIVMLCDALFQTYDRYVERFKLTITDELLDGSENMRIDSIIFNRYLQSGVDEFTKVLNQYVDLMKKYLSPYLEFKNKRKFKTKFALFLRSLK